MSTYWGYYCKDCKKETDHWINHGEEVLTVLKKHEKILNTAVKESDGWIEIHLMGFDIDDDYPLEWLEKHRGHNIVLKNEYGDEKED
jgi:hypothetical protein